MVTEVDGRWTVIGLTSWGYSCAKASAPAMFAKVSSFVYMLDQEDEGKILSKDVCVPPCLCVSNGYIALQLVLTKCYFVQNEFF